MRAEPDGARDEITVELEALRRELHKAQSELARLKMLRARDQYEREEIPPHPMVTIACLVGRSDGPCIEKRTN
jgi:hypothetical protein